MDSKFLSGKKKLFFLLLYISDIASLIVSFIIALLLMGFNLPDTYFIRVMIFTLLILIMAYSYNGLYNDKRTHFNDNDLMNIIYSLMITAFIMVSFLLMFNPGEPSLLLLLITTLAITAVITIFSRVILDMLIYLARKRGYDVKNTVFFGDEDDELLMKLKDKYMGYKIIKVTKDFNTLKKYLYKTDIVFIKSGFIDEKMLKLMTNHDKINWKIVSSILNLVIDPVTFDEFRDYPIINISNNESTNSYEKIKRAMDILLSGFGLIILSPLFLLIIVLMKILMPGPIFFKQERLGKKLKPFKLYKFRTMVIDAEERKKKLKNENEVKGLFKMKNDPRITSFGKFLRRSCIDELAQLINIFKGDMSIVGPRPHLKEELKHFKGWRMARFNIKPGLTGLWQVNGRHELNFDKAILYDIYYTKHMSLMLDISIILKTIPSILMTRGKY